MAIHLSWSVQGLTIFLRHCKKDTLMDFTKMLFITKPIHLSPCNKLQIVQQDNMYLSHRLSINHKIGYDQDN